MTKSGKHCGKRRNCSFWAISSFVTMFSKSIYMRERVNPCPHTTNRSWNLLYESIRTHIQPICSRQLWKHLDKSRKIPYKWKYYNWTELKTLGQKGEIARSEQFHLLSQCFQKSSAAKASKSFCMSIRVNLFPTLWQICSLGL